MKYRLNKAETVPVTINYLPVTKTIRGRAIVTWDNYIRLAPDKVYESDDTAMIDYLRNHKTKARYTSQLESVLKANNVPYEVEMCKSCGGKIKKISYNTVEVYDAE